MNDLQDIVDQIFKDFLNVRYPKWFIAGLCVEVAFITLCGAALVKYLFF